MNNQVKLIDESKLLDWINTMYNKKLPDEIKEYRDGRQTVLDLLEIQIKSGRFAPDTPPVPTIGCSECDYKGYFEYETGVVDEGTRIKEIAKEPCDCVIDRVPTIKPGDTTGIKVFCGECNFECVIQYDAEGFVYPEGHCPNCGGAADLEVVE